jgi:hypothetical protein
VTRAAALLLLLLAGVATTAAAAPVPPPPALTSDFLAGEWDMTWGGQTDCALALNADGTFCERYRGNRYVGLWWLDGGTLVLREHYLDGGVPQCPATFRFALDGRRWPVVVGRADGVAVIALTRRP